MLKGEQKVASHQVPDIPTPQRLQEYAVGIFDLIPTRKGIKKAIKKGLVKVNGKKGFTATFIRGGEVLELFRENTSHRPIVSLELEILHEDEHLAVVYKPAGILVSGNKRFTLENALPYNLKVSKAADAMIRPLPVHRLDYPTTGALLVAKTATALRELKSQFERQGVQKWYLSVVMGFPATYGRIDRVVDHKASQSEFERLAFVPSEKYSRLNLLRLQPYTGRRHQLRQHLSHIGCPIFGDLQYGPSGLNSRSNGLYLHSEALQFQHPSLDHQMKVMAPWPKKFIKLFPQIQAMKA